MASEQNSQDKLIEQSKKPSGESRRGFLAKLGFGAAALALVAGPLGALRFNRGGNSDSGNEFPGEDSIFHPASDPRSDPRRTGRS